MKRLIIALLIILGISGAYLKYKPTITYISGRIAAYQDRVGWISGERVFQLGVPWHRQEASLSCEIASLKMALNAVGIPVSESELTQYLEYDPTPKSNGVWGNPYKGFVGAIDGRMSHTGYGVYWDPIAELGLRYTRTESIAHGSLTQILQHVEAGRPVVVWGYYGAGNRMVWTTPTGETITAVHGEHARVLVGFTGTVENPSEVILLDPIYGELHWSVQQFVENWQVLESGAVVVYPYPKWVKTLDNPMVWEISADQTTRYALDMDWNTFIAQGGVGEGIKTISQEELEKYTEFNPDPIPLID